MPETLEQCLREALRSLSIAREIVPSTEAARAREVVMREVVSAQQSVSRALQLIGVGP